MPVSFRLGQGPLSSCEWPWKFSCSKMMICHRKRESDPIMVEGRTAGQWGWGGGLREPGSTLKRGVTN